MAIDLKLMTIEEMAGIADDDFSYELFEGELVRMPPPGAQHAVVVLNIGGEMRAHVIRHQLGRVMTNGGIVLQRFPDTLLAPDIAFFRSGPPTEALANVPGFVEVLPDLVVEVVTPSDSASDMQRKQEKYLACGVTMVAIVWPRTRMVTVHTVDGTNGSFHANDLFNFGELIPGFEMTVADAFK